MTDNIFENLTDKVEVVIEIPKYYLTHPQDYNCLAECVRRGTILPKGHGAIKDVSKIEIPMCEDRTYERWFQAAINAAPTIIKADKEYEVETITRGNCMICGKELDEGLFFCKECEAKAESEEVCKILLEMHEKGQI